MDKIPITITDPVLSCDDLCTVLHDCVRVINQADGDRDYMNPSNLNVQDTRAIANYIEMAIARIDELRTRHY